MIQILELEKGYAPIIVCDQCGLRIEDAELAAAIAPVSEKFQMVTGEFYTCIRVHVLMQLKKWKVENALGRNFQDICVTSYIM